MAVQHEEARTYTLAFAQLFDLCVQAVEQAGFSLENAAPDQGLIEAKRGLSWKAAGHNVTVHVGAAGRVQVICAVASRFAVTDYGASEEHVATIFARLEALLAEAGQTPAAPAAHPTLQPGARGPQVSALQSRLNQSRLGPDLDVDGIYGPATVAAVRAFQKATGLAADGIVGPDTWLALEDFASDPIQPGAGLASPAVESAARSAAPAPADERRQQEIDLARQRAQRRRRLRQRLSDHFNLSELEDICFYVSIPYEDFGASGKAELVRAMIAYGERSGRLDELVDYCRQLRPEVDW